MSAYVIVQVEFHPGPELTQYRERAGAAIARYGGRFLVRGQEKLLVEGKDNGFAKVIVIEFDTPDQARNWYSSPEYGEALKLQPAAMTRELFIVPGN